MMVQAPLPDKQNRPETIFPGLYLLPPICHLQTVNLLGYPESRIHRPRKFGIQNIGDLMGVEKLPGQTGGIIEAVAFDFFPHPSDDLFFGHGHFLSIFDPKLPSQRSKRQILSSAKTAVRLENFQQGENLAPI
jgi:hypothetical protein